MSSLIDKIRRTNSEFNMFMNNDSILIGLSGGADSVCLLLVLNDLKQEFNLTLSAIHINHNLRGDESKRDEEFTKKLCECYGIPLLCESHDVTAYASENKLSIEEAARNIRYSAFFTHSKDKLVATAHTLSDNQETIIYNLIRGTSLKGLTGIPKVRENIIRPLINCSRQEVEEYLREKKQDYITDSSNLCDDYTRNKIRHHIIPLAKEINSSFDTSIYRMVDSLSIDENYLDILSEQLLMKARLNDFEYQIDEVKNAHLSLIRRFCVKILDTHSVQKSYKNVEFMVEILQKGGKINLASNIFIEVKSNKMNISYENKVDAQYTAFCKPITFNENIVFFNKNIKLHLHDMEYITKNKNIQSLFLNNLIDYGKIFGKVILRNRIAGDKIKFKGNKHTTTIKKLFNEKVPVNMRGKIAMLADDEGVFFVDGFGISDRVAINNLTKKVLLVEIKGNNNGEY